MITKDNIYLAAKENVNEIGVSCIVSPDPHMGSSHLVCPDYQSMCCLMRWKPLRLAS